MRASGPRLVLSYVLDWIVIILIAIAAAAITLAEPNHRPFSLVDPNISFPYVEKEKVSTSVLFVTSLVAPAIIITIVTLAFVPSSTAHKQSSKIRSWRHKLWEWNAGWMGLALACALTVLFTNALKLLIGKPRPDLLSRCQPDLSAISSHTLGGILDQVSEGALVSWTICQQTDRGILKDGFQSYPSGHASLTFAGFFYLALFLSSKFAVRLPSLLARFPSQNGPSPSAYSATTSSGAPSGDSTTLGKRSPTLSAQQEKTFRDEAAAPPLYLLLLPLIPICIATYISSTRFSDFRHHGFDILFGAVLGIMFAWISFKMYQSPVNSGDGWAWGPRTPSKAFGIAIGTPGYVESAVRLKKSDDIEAGQMSSGTDGHLSSSRSENGEPTQPKGLR